MTFTARLRAFLLALAVAAALHCGAPQQPQRASMDSETGETSDAPAKPKTRARKAAASPGVVVLSLKGIPVLKKTEVGEAGAESGDEKNIASPPPGKIGPPLPPAEEEQPSSEDQGPQEQEASPEEVLPPRNLFAFEEDPAVVLERKRQAEEAARLAEEAAKRAAEERQRQEEYLRAHPPPPQPPAIPFQFIGYMGPPEDRIGVFATPAVLLARKGDMILGKFKIVSIGYESAEIGFTDFAQTQRIPLSAGGK
jgi:hypothetical protein